MPNILMICTGNLCRSPMAMALLQDKLDRDAAHQGWQVQSAGVWATDGRPASTYAVMEMAERDIDLTGHRARPVSRKMVDQADLVLAMTRNHVEALQMAFPGQKQKIHLLSEMIEKEYDICDPYGGSRMEYAYTAQELEELIESGYARMVSLVETPGESS